MNSKDLLLSAMLPIDMLDENDDMTQSEMVGDVIIQYDFLQIIENIGKNDFKENYLVFIADIKKQSFNNQKILCYHIINKIQEIYNFVFPEKIDISSFLDIEDIYTFIEFLEYDNIDFLMNILEKFNIDITKIDLDYFLENNQDRIINEINSYNKINLPLIFINICETLENNILIKIIRNMIIKNKELIANELKIKKLKNL